MGLYDVAVGGNADHLMAHAFCGEFHSECLTLKTYGTENEEYFEHYLRWAQPAWKIVHGRLGFVPGAAFHLWHGEVKIAAMSGVNTS